MKEIDESADCEFLVEEKKAAVLKCKLDIKEYKTVKFITFNTTEVEYNNEYNISFNKLNQVFLINESDQDKKQSKGNIILIVGIIIGSIIIIASIILFLFFYFKRKKDSNVSNTDVFSTQMKLKNPNNLTNINENNNSLITSINPGEKIMTVNFVSMGFQDIINYSLPCKNTDKFKKLKDKLYKDFPILKDFNVYFSINTNNIEEDKTLEENKIKSNDIINIFKIESD